MVSALKRRGERGSREPLSPETGLTNRQMAGAFTRAERATAHRRGKRVQLNSPRGRPACTQIHKIPRARESVPLVTPS
jgi:hypothetical protein